MWRALAAIGDELPDDVRVVVVRGEGDSFSAGPRPRDARPASAVDGAESVAGLLRQPDDEISATIDGYQRGLHLAARPAVRLDRRGPGPRDRRRLPARPRLRPAGAWPTTRSSRMKEPALGLVPDLTGTKPLVEICWLLAGPGDLCHRTVGRRGRGPSRSGWPRSSARPTELDATVSDLVAALTAPMAGAVRETKALLQRRAVARLEEQRRPSVRRRSAGSGSSRRC